MNFLPVRFATAASTRSSGTAPAIGGRRLVFAAFGLRAGGRRSNDREQRDCGDDAWCVFELSSRRTPLFVDGVRFRPAARDPARQVARRTDGILARQLFASIRAPGSHRADFPWRVDIDRPCSRYVPSVNVASVGAGPSSFVPSRSVRCARVVRIVEHDQPVRLAPTASASPACCSARLRDTRPSLRS